jgi:hypothetical protein
MPVFDSRKGLLQAPSKKDDRDASKARCTGYLLSPQTMVRSEYLPDSNMLGDLAGVMEVGR